MNDTEFKYEVGVRVRAALPWWIGGGYAPGTITDYSFSDTYVVLLDTPLQLTSEQEPDELQSLYLRENSLEPL